VTLRECDVTHAALPLVSPGARVISSAPCLLICHGSVLDPAAEEQACHRLWVRFLPRVSAAVPGSAGTGGSSCGIGCTTRTAPCQGPGCCGCGRGGLWDWF